MATRPRLRGQACEPICLAVPESPGGCRMVLSASPLGYSRAMSAEFRQALSRFPSGITVVTTTDGTVQHGLTVSAFSSVSVEPPLILVCIAAKSPAHAMILSAQRFAVSILGRDQKQVGAQFAGMVAGVSDRFAGIETETASTTCPIISGSQAWLDCQLHQHVAAGDHGIFIGRVVSSGAATGEPLLYFDRDWRALQREAI